MSESGAVHPIASSFTGQKAKPTLVIYGCCDKYIGPMTVHTSAA